MTVLHCITEDLVDTSIQLYSSKGGGWDKTLGATIDGNNKVYAECSSNLSHADASHLHIYDGSTEYVVLTTSGFRRPLWAWGDNGHGELGLGDTADRSSPVQVGGLTSWNLISAGQYYSLAIKTDGSLWAWGFNGNGRLGLGDTIHRSSPVQVGSLTNWNKVDCGYDHSLAIKTDGTLWAWGFNGNGRLGLGDTIFRSSPTQVGSLTDWKEISGGGTHSLALR
jgi:alpha-tubulin suppressor-like RCC1 family protein